MTLETEGLTLFQAARNMGVPFSAEVHPQDREVALDGRKFHYLDWGSPDKEPMLFLHGVLQQSHSWDFVSLSLCSDFHVMALDARGHGESQWAEDGDYSLDAHQRDLDAFAEALGLKGLLLIGHSMGGRNSYVFTSRHPEVVKALVIVDTGPRMQQQGISRIQSFRELPDELDSFEEFADRIQEYTGRTREQVLGALKYSIRRREDGKWTWKYDKLLRSPGFQAPSWAPEELWECLGRIGCPTLVIRGDNSDLFTQDTLDRMMETIPNSTSAVVPGAGHLVNGDNPAGFLQALRSFLDGV
jgi:pimeloyl-ACP methyl ester carboxylesterase